MLKTIISDTSCLILLSKIGKLDLLNKIYGEVIITPEISIEFGQSLPDWIKIISVKNRSKCAEISRRIVLAYFTYIATHL